MMAPAPMTVVTTTTSGPGKAKWHEPQFMEVENSVKCCFRAPFCPINTCTDKHRTFENFQDLKCGVPGCTYDACARCESEERFCPACFGPRIWTGCGRPICAHHTKWYHNHCCSVGARETVVCSEGCDDDMKMQKMKHCLFGTFCGCLNCCIYCCCPNKCEVGQRYRGEQGEIKYNGRGDPMIG